MKFITRVVPAVLAAFSLVQASVVVPRTDGGIFDEYLDALNKHNLTILADNYKRIAGTSSGKSIVDNINSGKEFTILAPKNKAFDSDDKKLDPRQLEYNTLFGNIDNNFKPDDHHNKRDGQQSRSTAPSTMTRSGAPNNKRSEYKQSPFQVQVIDRFRSFWKRWEEFDLILVDRPVGDVKVVDRFNFKNLVILIIDEVLALPPKISELLCLPLLKTAPKGLLRFGEALKKAGLQDLVDNKDAITIFAPVDECLDDIDKMSKDDLAWFLKNHFFFGKIVYSPLFPKIREAKAESGKELKFSYENDIHYVCCGESKAVVLRADVIPSNGVLHIIDRPLKCD
ncbi:unnamed protein product [Rhizoctonia solani]|uniref:FAS1 domain-containing protein n=2 Tax=Rhizoctonia solani TaxID=456999 RepID=A0A8H3HQB8_9AGAM|nr:fasciclin domain protein [Rhizoctonia solani 123E]CAE6537560.1 unnamed protein product [Rhizoctonia solani]